MFPSVSLVFLAVILAADAAPSPRTTVPILTKYAEKRGGGYDIIKADAARIAHLVSHGHKVHAMHNGTAHGDKRATYSFPVTNAAVSYTASVGVGSPAKYYTLVVDTGSSNTWVGAQSSKRYVATSTSKSTGSSVGVTYGSGSFTGILYTDRVTLASNLIINSQMIGAASSASGFGSGIDGILGVGPNILTSGTISGSSSTIPTVSDSLFAAKTISTEVLGIYFAPSTSQSSTNGQLTFGGADTSKCTSAITYTPITTTAPSKYYWGITQSVQYNGKTILNPTSGIVDTGTTLLYLASNAYTSYVSATGATLDSTTGFLRINSAQYTNLKNMTFSIQGQTLTLIPNAQIWPRALNKYIGGSSSYIYLIVNNVGSASGSGLDFINGQKFLERFYSVYDTTSKRVGFASTSYTTQNIN